MLPVMHTLTGFYSSNGAHLVGSFQYEFDKVYMEFVSKCDSGHGTETN